MNQDDLLVSQSVDGNLLNEVEALRRRIEVLESRQLEIASDYIFRTADGYTVSNLITDRSYDANTVTVAELADVLGTLLTDLGLR